MVTLTLCLCLVMLAATFCYGLVKAFRKASETILTAPVLPVPRPRAELDADGYAEEEMATL